MFSLSTEKLVKLGFGVTTNTYFRIVIVYPYGPDDITCFWTTAVFGRN